MSKKKNKEELMERDTEMDKELAKEELYSETEEMNEIEIIRARIAELELSVDEWKDKYLRSMAEFDNYRRRSIEEKSDWIKRATEKLALSVCDVLDNFDRALMQVKDDQKEDSFVKGIIMIDQQLKSALEKEGVKRIEALGDDFDLRFHEALANIPSEYEEGKVAAIIQNGYTMHDKLIRPVRVAVSIGTTDINKDTED